MPCWCKVLIGFGVVWAFSLLFLWLGAKAHQADLDDRDPEQGR